MIISIIAAISEKGVIGAGNELLWHLPEDLKNFKKLTLGKYILMGRKTWESIGKPLPGRTNIVITREPVYEAVGCVIVNSIEEALEVARANNQDEIFIIGGGEIYKKTLPLADRLYLTHVHTDLPGDTFFPEVDWSQWQKVDEKSYDQNSDHPYSFTMAEYRKQIG